VQHFDKVTRNQMDTVERVDGDANERRYQHTNVAENKLQHDRFQLVPLAVSALRRIAQLQGVVTV
jgi:hypothetical protein